VGFSRGSLAERAGLCRLSIRKWEISSRAIPGAMYSHLCRVVCMDMVDIAIDAARGDARSPEAEKALAAAVRMGFVKSH
jgi:hypothetical protein